MPTSPAPNQYSRLWFDIFSNDRDSAQTAREISFIQHWLPLPLYARVLDLCCGTGRHSNRLADAGYAVVGLDRDAVALGRAHLGNAKANANAQVRADMRAIPFAPASFAAAVCLWQSFGYFDESNNRDVLAQVGRVLQPRGRFILDVYHRGFFERNQGTRSFIRNNLEIRETKSLSRGRLNVELDYARAGDPDCFEWQLYEPDELCEMAREVGLSSICRCANFEAAEPPSPGVARMQLVFEKLE